MTPGACVAFFTIPSEFVDQVFETIERSPQHTYQMLTKRADRMAACFRLRWPPANAWPGVSVENRRYGVPRINFLRQVPAKVRLLSVEPLLERLGPA